MSVSVYCILSLATALSQFCCWMSSSLLLWEKQGDFWRLWQIERAAKVLRLAWWGPSLFSQFTHHSVWGQRVWSPVAIHVISAGVKDAPDKLVECRIDKMSSLHAFSSPWCFIVACFIQYMGHSYSAVHFNVKHVSLLKESLICFKDHIIIIYLTQYNNCLTL